MAAPDFSVSPQGDEITFLHSVFCAASLPRRRFSGRDFLRVNGRASLAVQAGFLDEGDGLVARSVPHGVMPRLLLAWLTSQAARSAYRQDEIELGATPRALLRELGLDGQGARYAALRESLYDLAAAKFTFGWQGVTEVRTVVRRFVPWGQPGGARLVLGADFLRDLQGHAVPLDQRALARLSGSPLALDLYCFCAQRFGGLDRALALSWVAMHRQFGQEFSGRYGVADFRAVARPALAKVLEVYPGARITVSGEGVLFLPSTLSVPRRGG